MGGEELVDLFAVAAWHADKGLDDLEVVGESHEFRRS
jgi:hypothetical protein